ncbi:putative helicase mug81 [Drechslerella stenobrocha 248]|uniref:Putative helicase mug81 n=1 Tax=Drechslerella stenobrocha 248 TaxID=1043628 RepID=W7HM97_9PEZI|nr:putative helicase mug81 [Drechslerella stenobrocha 248]
MESPDGFDAEAFLKEVEEMERLLQEYNKSNSGIAATHTDDFELSDPEVLSSDSDEDALFDVYDIDEDAGSSREQLHQTPSGSIPRDAKPHYDQHWLSTELEAVALRTGSAMGSSDLYNNVLQLLQSTTSDMELQSSLPDILGFEELDLIGELISHRAQIIRPPANSFASNNASIDGFNLLTPAQQRERLKQADFAHKTQQLGPKLVGPDANYPHVYKSHDAGNTLSFTGKKYALPPGSESQEFEKHQEIRIPPNRVGTVRSNAERVEIKALDNLCRKTFVGYQSLNRMQSLVYPIAYQTNENLLICAPTGAGKTDAAMLTILHTIRGYCHPQPSMEAVEGLHVDLSGFKIVYVAPMKALAAEVVVKLGKRLSWLGVEVRELTGDMHLTKAEILRTQIIVTTPEKWDVVTRKSTGDNELVQKVRLLIIDEVHMLHDERGPVIETLVARTQRQVETTQSMIRIVGLSATLPNYVDVATFLKVNPMQGLFYFDQSFRPVPLEQHFVGVKGKAGSKVSNENLDRVSFEKVREMLEQGHQVMVFVHSRKDTVKSARLLYEMATDEQCTDLLDNTEHPKYDILKRDIEKSKGRELRELFKKGLGVHHAGMLRTDRNLMERLFSEGVIKVLCCTATLAWGVNLPAAAVVIKGTQVYNPQKGGHADLGILDVLQIFGRAGRPQFEKYGIGIICTTHDKLAHYLSAITQQQPIESRLTEKIVDNLNAEVSLGTVTSVDEGVQWLGYTYLFVRMKKNPMAYGIDWSEIQHDSSLGKRRRELIIKAARTLQKTQMMIYDDRTESLTSKNVGRIASNYYILSSSIEIFNTMMTPHASEADVFKTLSMSGEFDQIKSRDNEAKELARLLENDCPCDIEGTLDTAHGKTNVLLQSYISRANIEDFALVLDTNYIAQNAARIARALFLIALERRWGFLCLTLLSICKSIEKRRWSYDHPLTQFDLPGHITKILTDKESASSIQMLQDMDALEIGDLIHNKKVGYDIKRIINIFPMISVDVETAPLNRDVLKVRLIITPEFEWSDRLHGNSESYWIWIENSETAEILHYEYFILTRKKFKDEHELNFVIPLSDPLPTQLYVRCLSDRWIGAENVTATSFQHLIRPDTESFFTDLLNLQPLPITALDNPALESIYGSKFQYFNPMQTQLFHTLYHSKSNILLGSPTGSGKTVTCELAMWAAFRDKPGSKVVYIAPMKALVKERVKDWNARIVRPMGLHLVELTGDNTPDTRSIRNADIIITTPEKWDGISRSWQTRDYVRKVSLVIIDEIHLLGGDRGPILEIIVSRMNYIASQTSNSVRLMGMSTACANALDVGNWLGVKEDGLFNFRNSVRPVPLETYIDGFPEKQGFCPLMASMNRPAFLAIKSHSPTKPVIIFVASRRQTRLTAKDLIAFCGLEDNPRRFLNLDEDDLIGVLSRVRDTPLKEALAFGIGLHHAGLVESDRLLAEELFLTNKIQILVATSTLAWGVNLPAHLVIVKGTQFFDAKTEGYKDMDLTDVLQMMGRAGRPQFDTSGIARIFTQEAKKSFYKYFLNKGFPVESSLHKVLDDHLGAEVSAGTIKTKQDSLDYLTWTFFFRRLHKNPNYYGLEIAAEDQQSIVAQEEANAFLVGLVDTSVNELQKSGCLISEPTGRLEPTALGKIASYYYLSHKTIRHLLKKAKRGAKFEDCLLWMSGATEYNELPVRHNEDLVNAELSKFLPYEAGRMGLPMWDPHVKACLLLQAHMARAELPISDYNQDQITVLDQSIRILQASIDVLAELGLMSTCLTMMNLMQCIKQARWPNDGPFSTLPGVNFEREQRRLEAGASQPTSLENFDGISRDRLTELAKELGVRPNDEKQFLRVALSLPLLEISVHSELTGTTITVKLTRKNRPLDDGYRIHAPKFPKSQTEGYFILFGSEETDTVWALKRVSWPSNIGGGRNKEGAFKAGKQPSITLTLEVPPEARTDDYEGGGGSGKMALWIVSDGYLGMRWKKSL